MTSKYKEKINKFYLSKKDAGIVEFPRAILHIDGDSFFASDLFVNEVVIVLIWTEAFVAFIFVLFGF